MITVQEAIEKFKSVAAINAELKRSATIKAHHRVWAQWGNVESRESYNRILAYEKVLKQAKQQMKSPVEAAHTYKVKAVDKYDNNRVFWTTSHNAEEAQREVYERGDIRDIYSVVQWD